jgi:hypothetical protein
MHESLAGPEGGHRERRLRAPWSDPQCPNLANQAHHDSPAGCDRQAVQPGTQYGVHCATPSEAAPERAEDSVRVGAEEPLQVVPLEAPLPSLPPDIVKQVAIRQRGMVYRRLM